VRIPRCLRGPLGRSPTNISENVILPKCSTFYICERGGVAIHGEETKKKKQVDQFGQGGSSKFSFDKFGEISSDMFGPS
jgi:hypothetical protein